MKNVICTVILFVFTTNSLFAEEEYVTLKWGSFVTIPAEKVGVFQSAVFSFPNLQNSLDILMISGTFNGEVETLPAMEIGKVVPTTKVGGKGQGDGTPAAPLIIEGPTDLSLQFLLGSDPGANAFANVVILLKDKVSGSSLTYPDHIPRNTVVIPTDANGLVDIILESSTDLVNWTPALTGQYGASDSNRFFRIRAEHINN
jgi:hypothetical protein